MAEEKKVTKADVTDKKAAKKPAKKKDDRKFSQKFTDFFKNIWAAIKRFFKGLRGETKKIIWPTRQMVLKSTGVVLAAILVIGAGIWIIDFAISGAVTAVDKAAAAANATEAVTEAAPEADAPEEVTAEAEAEAQSEDAAAIAETEAPTAEQPTEAND